MRVTQKKGDIAKAKAISTFTEKRYDVAVLLTESAPYDLIVDTDEGLKRVQVKYSKGKVVDLRRIHSNSSGYVVKKYKGHKDFDWLYVYIPKMGEFLVKHDLKGRSYINMNSTFTLR
jgi:hypothetical protein